MRLVERWIEEAKAQTFYELKMKVQSVIIGDTDTTAFITGTIAGLKYGIKSIPEEWINQLARINDIKELCNKFSEYCFEIRMDQMKQGKKFFL